MKYERLGSALHLHLALFTPPSFPVVKHLSFSAVFCTNKVDASLNEIHNFRQSSLLNSVLRISVGLYLLISAELKLAFILYLGLPGSADFSC